MGSEIKFFCDNCKDHVKKLSLTVVSFRKMGDVSVTDQDLCKKCIVAIEGVLTLVKNRVKDGS